MKQALSDFDVATLETQFAAWQCKTSHAKRLLTAYYRQGGRLDLQALLLGNTLTEQLQNNLQMRQATVRAQRDSADGTTKLLLALERGGSVETVLMPTRMAERAAGCISSQIGCAMGCDFCASTRHGVERNLEPGEMVEQFLFLRELAQNSNRRLATIVFMGMGEPLLNLENVLIATERMACADLGGIGGKQITISTVGIVPGIEALARSKQNLNLAVSLHAPDDETRLKLVPMTKRYGVVQIVQAARNFYEETGRITNMEYCLIEDVNASDEHAHALARLLHGFRTHVNLIPYNPTGPGLSGRVYQPPTLERMIAFLQILRDQGVVSHLRQARGADVNAACGQLHETLRPV